MSRSQAKEHCYFSMNRVRERADFGLAEFVHTQVFGWPGEGSVCNATYLLIKHQGSGWVGVVGLGDAYPEGCGNCTKYEAQFQRMYGVHSTLLYVCRYAWSSQSITCK